MAYNGRKVISIAKKSEDITKDNIASILSDAYETHLSNQGEMDYLFNYYKGIQPIKNRTKKYNAEVNNKIVENHANEIVSFKTGYLLMKPIQYVSRKESTDISSLEKFNDFNHIESKEFKDKETAVNQSICGTALRLVVQNENYDKDDPDSCPFEIETIDPREGFVIYSSLHGKKPLIGVVIDTITTEDDEEKTLFQCYTKDKYYEFYQDSEDVIEENHTFGSIPLIEYPLNNERIGDFELVIDLLDAINTIQSNRVDGVEQFIQALMVFENVDVDSEEFQKMKELGAIEITSKGELKANVKYLTQELNQTQVQTLKNDMYEIVLKICGVPSTSSANTSDSSNNGAIVLKNGWQNAETKAQDTETFFKESEKKSLKLALTISKILTGNAINLSVADIDIKFTRRNYEDILTKKQVLLDMLNSGKVAPQLAFVVCGLFQDPENAYEASKAYIEEQEKKAQELAKMQQGEGKNNDDEDTTK